MKLELTEKDILLLKIACSALIAFFMVRFLLMPGISRYQENKIQGELLDESITKIETAIDNIPLLEQSVQNRLGQLEEVSKPYYERMENREVDELLTGLALKHGLFPVSLSIDGAQAAIPEPYLYVQNQESADSDGADQGMENAASGSTGTGEDSAGMGVDTAGEAPDGAGAGAEADSAGEAPENARTALENAEAALDNTGGTSDSAGAASQSIQAVSEDYILTAVGHMVLQGDETKLFAFLDDLEDNYPALKLRFLRRDEKLYFDQDWNMVEQPDISCDLAVYMYDMN